MMLCKTFPISHLWHGESEAKILNDDDEASLEEGAKTLHLEGDGNSPLRRDSGRGNGRRPIVAVAALLALATAGGGAVVARRSSSAGGGPGGVVVPPRELIATPKDVTNSGSDHPDPPQDKATDNDDDSVEGDFMTFPSPFYDVDGWESRVDRSVSVSRRAGGEDEEEGPCYPSPCQNKGACTPDDTSDYGYICECDYLWVGNWCEIRNPCLEYLCHNGGTCIFGDGGPYCECSQGWKGSNCTTPDPCDPSPCQNGGTCTVGDSGEYSCACSQGWAGDDCDLPCYNSLLTGPETAMEWCRDNQMRCCLDDAGNYNSTVCWGLHGKVCAGACVGNLACWNAGRASNGDQATPILAKPFTCRGNGACYEKQGTVGSGSCVAEAGGNACTSSIGDIGAGSCIDAGACMDKQGDVGNGSCTAPHSCQDSVAAIGNNACTVYMICFGADEDVADGECTQSSSC
eukprot:CAMPEP_0197448644 /NCGR_PEP_ID=MMETSP1175-20131217/18296_1 /TAXON_ID=1003142 /ORGANISM="Triceratium dubium, Strain CCMP147" /LENGTH=457 /DNA_ID=CAMNT_0042980477 /DNA_START=128 /DNA_END=1501 /DNA_ORIENTATION=+